jgi:uncharacterized protein
MNSTTRKTHSGFAIAICTLLIALGFALGRLDVVGAMVLLACVGLAYFAAKSAGIPGTLAKIALAGIAFTIMSGHHWFPGVYNLKVIDDVRFSEDSIPYSMYLNLDKTVLGILFLFLFAWPVNQTSIQPKQLLKSVAVVLALQVLTLMALALAIGYVRFDPKFPAEIWLWSANNLLLVCMAEEAFFRGFIQTHAQRLFRSPRLGQIAALIAAAILFGLAHFKGGVAYVALAAVSGLFYGYVYQRTKRIEAPILLHFLFNLIHFLLFSYPARMG